MKAVLYCRVSSKEQEETGYSLPAQEKLLKADAEKKGFNIDRTFSIQESASGKRQRQTFTEMMAYVQKAGVKIIICEKADRLTRNFKDAVMIDDWLEADEERQVHLVKDSLVLHKNSRSQEKLNWGIRILFAKNYIDNLSEEVRKGQKEKIAQGWLPTRPPLGYITIGEQGHRIHVIDNDKAPLVRRMFELYATGEYSLGKLTHELADAGLRNSSGAKVCKSRIHTLLSEPFYTGEIRWNNIMSQGKHEPLVSKELFAAVQRQLQRKNAPTYSKHEFLFKGRFSCAECGGTIAWEMHKGIVYGHCNHYRRCTQAAWSKETDVEQQLLTAFAGFQLRSNRLAEWIRKALKESHQDEMRYFNDSVDELRRQHDRVVKRIDSLYDDKLDGTVDEAFYARKLEQYKAERDSLARQIESHAGAKVSYYDATINIFDLSQRAAEIYKGMENVSDKRTLMRLVFEDLKLDQGAVSYKLTKPFELLSEAVRATNDIGSKEEETANLGSYSFEPNKKAVAAGKTPQLQPSCPSWLDCWDDFRTLDWAWLDNMGKPALGLLSIPASYLKQDGLRLA